MKARVLAKFKDKYTGKIHKEGETITISKDRFEEILTVAPLVEEIKEAKAAKKEKAAE